jgi:hypothetical protein
MLVLDVIATDAWSGHESASALAVGFLDALDLFAAVGSGLAWPLCSRIPDARWPASVTSAERPAVDSALVRGAVEEVASDDADVVP